MNGRCTSRIPGTASESSLNFAITFVMSLYSRSKHLFLFTYHIALLRPIPCFLVLKKNVGGQHPVVRCDERCGPTTCVDPEFPLEQRAILQPLLHILFAEKEREKQRVRFRWNHLCVL